ncbi:hypothetical protein [Streptomyces sp. NPDC091209]|uniref:hypothetical protein n=1 Tax=Streptomyces sp. NPDC091209 TaxID=3365974 RepID=UPI0038304D8C
MVRSTPLRLGVGWLKGPAGRLTYCPGADGQRPLRCEARMLKLSFGGRAQSPAVDASRETGQALFTDDGLYAEVHTLPLRLLRVERAG